MKKSYMFSAVVLLCFCMWTVGAQPGNHYIGVKAGFGVPNLTSGAKSTPLSEGYSSRLGSYQGIVAEYNSGNVLGIRMELNYSSQGGNRNGIQALPLKPELAQLWQMLPAFGVASDDYMYMDIKNKAILNYLELPVLAKATFGLSPKWNFYMNAGPYLGIMLNAKNITKGSSRIYIDNKGSVTVDAILQQAGQQPLGEVNAARTEDITSDVHRFNVGGEGAVGFELILKSGKFFVEGGGNYGFVRIQKDDINGTNHTGAGTVTFGYMLRL
jgi:hypothetical protein